MEHECLHTKSSINVKTVLNCIKRGNPTAVAPQRLSPISEVEPFLLQWILLLAEMGNALTKKGIIELANDIIKGTRHAKKPSEFKKRQKIMDETNLGER
jgi:hypothetical protein